MVRSRKKSRILKAGAAGIGLSSIATLSPSHAQEALASAEPAPTVVVTGQRTHVDALSEEILDTPQSINVVPAEIIRQQGVSTLQEALKNVPGITLNAGEGGTHGDLVNLRGFSAGDDYFLDGLRDTGIYDRDAFNYDSVEVLKGPASTVFGRGSTGGVINQVTKTPYLGNETTAQVTAGTNDELRATADLNYQLSDTAAVRLAVMDMTAGVEGRPYVKNKRWGVAPSIGWGLGTDTSLTIKYLHQSENNLPDYGIPFLFGKPAPVKRSTFYGLPADDAFDTNVDVVTGRFEHRFNDVFTFTDSARYGRYTFDSRQTAPTYGSANCFNGALPFAGAPSCASVANPSPASQFNPYYPVLGTPIDQVFVQRDRPSGTGVVETLMNAADLTAKFATGPLAHTLVVGFEADSEDADLVRFTNQNTVIPAVPLLNPDPNQAFPGHQTTVRQLPTTDTDTIGAYIIDTVHIGKYVDVIGAVRYDHFHAKFSQPVAPVSAFQHTDNVTSPRGAVVFKPTPNASLYFAYGTSFNPSAENLSLAANNQALGPEKDRTYEIGGKWQLLNRRLALTGALFDTEMTNARITDPLNPSLQALSGTLKVRGAEFNVTGYITHEWEITAGYTALDPTAIGLAGAGIKGPIPNTAHSQANLWTTYEWDNGVEIGTGVNYVGVREAGTDNLTIPGSILVATVPSYVTWDAMVAYKINDNIRVQINGYNLTDKFYYANSYFTRPGENHVVPGTGRTFLLTLGFAY